MKNSTDKIQQVKLINKSGAYVILSTMGAGIVAIGMPDKDGNIGDVVTGYDAPEDYLYDGPCMGKTPGRYANRIAKGKFKIGEKEYSLAVNNGPNALHGGPDGFMNRLWKLEEHTDKKAVFSYTSSDGEEGYPGELNATVTYTLTEENELRIQYAATTDAPTVVNLTNHSYFNLDGHDAGCIFKHKLTIKASRWLPTDETLIPTGELAAVAGTPMDFTIAKEIGRDIQANFAALKYGKGYDNCWVLDALGTDCPQVRLEAAQSGRVLEVYTDQPGVQVYTGNWLDGCPKGKGGAIYHDYDAVAIECQGFPDAPNRPNFPSQVLLPGEAYKRSITFRFLINNHM